MTYPEGWHQASDKRARQLADKLIQAVGEQHILYGKRLRVVAYRHQDGVDELLCQHPEEEDLFSLLHLVWSLTTSETHRAAPIVEVQGSFQDFLNYEHDVQGEGMPEETNVLGVPLHSPLTCQLDWQLKEAEQRGERLGRQQGVQIGENRGLAIGEIQGQVKVLARQLCRRFSVTPTDAIARLRGASSEQYERWSDNILTAQTLEQVFQSGDDNSV